LNNVQISLHDAHPISRGHEGQPVKPREKRLVIVLGAVAAIAALLTWWLPHKGPEAASTRSAAVDPAPEPVPRIDLERLPRERPRSEEHTSELQSRSEL